MRACYRDANVVLICSINEGLTLTAYESCSMGVPIVSSDVGGQKDLVGDDVGALVPLQQSAMDTNNRKYAQSEVEMYVNKLVQILGDKDYADKLGNAARKKIEDGFSIELMIDKLHNEIQMLCTDRDREKKRQQLSNALRIVSHFSTDYYTIYLKWEEQSKVKEEQPKVKGILLILYSTYAALIKIPFLGQYINLVANAVSKKLINGKD